MNALGFRIKSGYAIAVVLTGSRHAPVAVMRRIIELSVPEIAETRQPYHDGFGKEHDDAREIARRIRIIRRCANRAIASFVRDACSGSEHIGVAGLVVGSVIDPQQIANPHIRAHASEGRLFRTVVEDALRAHGVSCTIIVDKQLATTAARQLRCGERAIKQTIGEFGKTIGGSWRADDKAAAIAAWLSLTNGLTVHRALN
jgi:hypothetical protein